MLGRHVYRVHPEWMVTKEGEDRSRASLDSREQAVAAAIRLAAKVRIENADGSIAEERLVGSDPGVEVQP
jgi:hypothetical protein